jgi:hemin uptake protein HemP
VGTRKPLSAHRPPSPDRAVPGAPAPATGPRRARSSTLLGPRGELIIDHAGEEYRLRRTRYGKLILTK